MELTDDYKGAVTQALTDYYAAFSTLDAHAVAPYFHEPSLLVSPAGVGATPTRAAVIAVFSTEHGCAAGERLREERANQPSP